MSSALNSTFSLPNCQICVDNPTQAVYQLYNLIVVGIVVPCVGLFGLVGNFLSALVYSRPLMRCSANVYLFSLALSDCMVICTGIFLYFLLAIECTSPYIATTYVIGAPYVFPVSHIAQTCSVYLVVLAAIDCFICTIFSTKIKSRLCTVTTARTVATLILIFSVLYNIPHWFEIHVIECVEPGWNMTLIMLIPTAIRNSPLYYTIYYTYLYTIVMTIGPLLLLIVLNCSIVSSTLMKSGIAEFGEDTFTLVMVILLFILCNMLALAINLFETFGNLGDVFSYLVDLSNLLIIFNSSANFVIYYAFGTSFRRIFWGFFRHKKRHVVNEELAIISTMNTVSTETSQSSNYTVVDKMAAILAKKASLQEWTVAI